ASKGQILQREAWEKKGNNNFCWSSVALPLPPSSDNAPPCTKEDSQPIEIGASVTEIRPSKNRAKNIVF
ncbi:hypothetical protein PanWU01x14_038930, partial [Parasponia andersonii]